MALYLRKEDESTVNLPKATSIAIFVGVNGAFYTKDDQGNIVEIVSAPLILPPQTLAGNNTNESAPATSLIVSEIIELLDVPINSDPRLSDARTPLSHPHGNITNDGKIGSTSGLLVGTGTDGLLETKSDSDIRTAAKLATTDSPTFAGGTFTDPITIRATNTTATATHIPIFTSNPGSTGQTLRNRTPSQLTEDLGLHTGVITIRIDGGGSAITTGDKSLAFRVPYACTITGWELVADVSGSCVVDIWKDTYANFPPTNADSITGSAKPTLTAAQKANSTTLTGWATSLAAGDYLEVEIESLDTIKVLTLTLNVTRA